MKQDLLRLGKKNKDLLIASIEEKNMIQAVIFDMDGVIVDSVPIHAAVWRHVASHFGFEFDQGYLDRVNGMITEEIARDAVKTFSLNVKPEDITALKRRLSGIGLRDGAPVFKGVKETIEYLKAQGLKTGLATSTSLDHEQSTLKNSGLCFDAVITKEQVMNSKPAPDIFMKCAETLGVDYGNCMVVEDSLNGIQAAKSAGMTAVAITNTTRKEKFTHADFIISDISGIKKLLEL